MMNETLEKFRNIGVVKWFDTVKGYGFVTNVVTNDDIFVHYSSIQGDEVSQYKTLLDGEYVSYTESKMDDGKSIAKDVTGVGGGKLLCQLPGKRVLLVNKSRRQENGNSVTKVRDQVTEA